MHHKPALTKSPLLTTAAIYDTICVPQTPSEYMKNSAAKNKLLAVIESLNEAECKIVMKCFMPSCLDYPGKIQMTMLLQGITFVKLMDQMKNKESLVATLASVDKEAVMAEQRVLKKINSVLGFPIRCSVELVKTKNPLPPLTRDMQDHYALISQSIVEIFENGEMKIKKGLSSSPFISHFNSLHHASEKLEAPVNATVIPSKIVPVPTNNHEAEEKFQKALKSHPGL